MPSHPHRFAWAGEGGPCEWHGAKPKQLHCRRTGRERHLVRWPRTRPRCVVPSRRRMPAQRVCGVRLDGGRRLAPAGPDPPAAPYPSGSQAGAFRARLGGVLGESLAGLPSGRCVPQGWAQHGVPRTRPHGVATLPHGRSRAAAQASAHICGERDRSARAQGPREPGPFLGRLEGSRPDPRRAGSPPRGADPCAPAEAVLPRVCAPL